MSKGSEELEALLKQVFGDAVRIVYEYHVGESLRLDFYLPDYHLGLEFHGRQHREYISHFHGDASGFEASKRRDDRKMELCIEKNIGLVTIWFDEELTIGILKSRCDEALIDVKIRKPLAKPEVSEYKKNQLEAARQARKEKYKWLKESKKQRST